MLIESKVYHLHDCMCSSELDASAHCVPLLCGLFWCLSGHAWWSEYFRSDSTGEERSEYESVWNGAFDGFVSTNACVLDYC